MPNPGSRPKGGQTEVRFRNEHLQYAIAWFGLAATLLGVDFAFRVKQKRLERDRVKCEAVHPQIARNHPNPEHDLIPRNQIML